MAPGVDRPRSAGRRPTHPSKMSYTTSRMWRSDQSKEYEAFARARCNYTHIAPLSPVVPRTWPEWIKHRLLIQEEAQSQELRRLAIKTLVSRIQETIEEYQPPFADKTFEDHLSSVLARESIWLPSYTAPPDREQAPWPTHDEMKHEENQRGKSGYCRFLPLPRTPGEFTSNWKQRSPIVPFQFDEVGHLNGEEEEGSPEHETDENMLLLVGNFLLKELEC